MKKALRSSCMVDNSLCPLLLLFESLCYMNGLLAQTHVAKLFNSNVVQDKASYDNFLNNLLNLLGLGK